MTNDAQRLFKLEQMVIKQAQLIAALQQQVGQLAQNQVAAAGGFGGGGGGAAGAFVAYNGSPIPAAGTPGDSPTPSMDDYLVYQLVGGIFQTVGSSTVTVYNPMPNVAGGAGIILVVVPVGDGSYMAQAQACTVL